MISALATTPPTLQTQPADVASLAHDERDTVIISTRVVEGEHVVVSRYGDDRWLLVGQPTNKPPSEQTLNFGGVAPAWRATMKAIVYRYMRRGREGQRRPSTRSVVKLFRDARPFLQHLDSLSITRLADVTPMVCAVYVDACKRHCQPKGAGKPLKAASLGHRFGAVEALHELSQHTGDPMVAHPWPGTSATHQAGLTGRGSGYRGGSTPLMPDEVFTALFQRAWSLVEKADALLDVRDELALLRQASGLDTITGVMGTAERRYVRSRGWAGTSEFRAGLLELRTACYIVVASLSGCRNHELAFIEAGACYSTEESDREENETQTYWWMRSQSTKTGEGRTEWLVPPAAVTALKVMERWAAPYQAMLEAEIAERRAADPLDTEIAEAQRHQRALFLAATPQKRNQVRTMSGQMWNLSLKAFARKCGLGWDLASHQFRRKFANYAARSQFGDLRYLRAHFKHWSMDMTLGYALNESQEMALYAEIQGELGDIKAGVVDGWMRADAALAGGYGRNIVSWRGSQAVTIFKDHRQMVRSLADSTAIRSNGHAWCTADDNLCVGNDLERTRCSDCGNAVIGVEHAPLYSGLFNHLKEVLDCDDIGEGGLNVVRRDMDRCRKVLVALGEQDPQERAA